MCLKKNVFTNYSLNIVRCTPDKMWVSGVHPTPYLIHVFSRVMHKKPGSDGKIWPDLNLAGQPTNVLDGIILSHGVKNYHGLKQHIKFRHINTIL